MKLVHQEEKEWDIFLGIDKYTYKKYPIPSQRDRLSNKIDLLLSLVEKEDVIAFFCGHRKHMPQINAITSSRTD